MWHFFRRRDPLLQLLTMNKSINNAASGMEASHFSTKITTKTNAKKAKGRIEASAETKSKEQQSRSGVHFNPCKIQMISDELFDQVFIDVTRQKEYSEELVTKCRRHLEAHNLWGQKVQIQEPIKFSLPKLEGNDIDDHFKNIASHQTLGYRNLLDKLVKTELPEFPSSWVFDVKFTFQNTIDLKSKHVLFELKTVSCTTFYIGWLDKVSQRRSCGACRVSEGRCYDF